MKRNQTLHESLIPLLVDGIGARSYLELGTHQNEIISRVRCETRYGVDIAPVENLSEVQWFRMTTAEFIRDHAARLAPFEFVFIDASHKLEDVQDDFFGIFPYVSSEGMVCLHDLNPETLADTHSGLCGDCWKFSPMLTRGFECVILPYHPGLAIVRKRVKWGPRDA